MMRLLTARRALALLPLGLAAACSAASSSSPSSGGVGGAVFAASTGTSTGAGPSTGSTTAGAGAGGGTILDAGGDGMTIDPDSGCGLITVKAKGAPLDLYIALGKSSSMFGTKWDGAKAGLAAFLADPASAGIKVALNFFPLDMNPTCDQFAYKPPAVPFALLPGNAAALNAAITAQKPDGFFTPIYPALGGALLAGIEEETNLPGDVAAVLLITDGQPNGPAAMCGGVNPDDTTVIATLAANALAYNPPVKTFVIGLPGVNQAFADQVATAGGTGAAILVTINGVQIEFENALAQVRGQALPCTYDLPSQVGNQIDVSHVNVLITPKGGQPTTLPQDPTCAGTGWKYDNAANPQRILFCPTSCKALKALTSAEVQIVLGCQTVLK